MAAKNYAVKYIGPKTGKNLILGIIVVFVYEFFQRERK